MSSVHMAAQAQEIKARIGVNAHLLSNQQGYRQAGIHRYISRLISNLSGSDFSFSVFTNNSSSIVPGSNIRIMTSSWPTQRRLARIMWEQLAWPGLAHGQFDLIHSMGFVLPAINICPGIVTVYDLSFERYPGRFPLLQRLYLSTQTRRSCQAANRIAAISNSTKEDVSRIYGVEIEKIDVVKPGVSDQFQRLSEVEIQAFKKEMALPSQFILHVGTIQPRKNLPQLVEAMAGLSRSDVALVLVGGKGWDVQEVYDRVAELGLEQRIRFTGFVPDSELPLWYNAAAALVFPSEFEGFGLPVLEAMSCGTPVIAAENSAIPEVTGQAALLFKTGDLIALIDHIENVLDDPGLADTMRKRGIEQAAGFTWQKAGQEMTAVYERALSQR